MMVRATASLLPKELRDYHGKVAGLPSGRDAGAEARLAEVFDLVNKMRISEWFLHVKYLGSPETPPPVKELRKQLECVSVAVDAKGTHWLLESKGAETGEVPHKDAAAEQWCDNATVLTGTKWTYLKVQQKSFETLQPSRLEHLEALRPASKLFTD